MKTVIILLLAAWLVLVLLGALIEGLLWLLFIGALLFLGTAVWGYLKVGRSGGSVQQR